MAATYITPQNARNYLYHVVENDSIELVPWTKPSVFRSNKFTSYAYFGKFNARGKVIRFELYEVNHYKNRTIHVFNSGYLPPPQLNDLVLYRNNKYLFQPDKQEYIPNSKHTIFLLNDIRQKRPIRFKWSDDINHIAIEMKSTIQNDMYHVYLKRTVDGKTDTVLVTNNWEQTYYSPNPIARISATYFNKAGEYEIIVKPEMPEGFNLQNNNLSQVVHFTVESGPVTVPLNTVIFIILIILSLSIRAYFYFRRKQKIAAQNKQIAELKLQSVRSQLNPHFIFNALAGVQNLMNKNEVENANKYLARFARLTRNVLDDGQKELTTIEHEVSILTDYLQMEQMRFGFNFTIEVDNAIDQQIEIPAMLLQPFVENAVKHGISASKSEGLIKVKIAQNDNDIILTVTDNGSGFNKSQKSGMGIKLCEERIKLLNGIYKNSSILLDINSNNKGAIVTIELKNWL